MEVAEAEATPQATVEVAMAAVAAAMEDNSSTAEVAAAIGDREEEEAAMAEVKEGTKAAVMHLISPTSHMHKLTT